MKTLILLSLSLASMTACFAQTDEAGTKPGELILSKPDVNDNTGNVPATQAAQTRIGLLKLQTAVADNSLLHPPMGCNAVVRGFINAAPAAIPWQKQPAQNLSLGLKALYRIMEIYKTEDYKKLKGLIQY